MTSLPHRSAAAAILAVAALSLTACGGDSGTSASTSASKDEFCASAKLFTDPAFLKAVQDKDYEGLADKLNAAGKKAIEVGTPKDIPAEARKGFEVQAREYEKISADDLEKAISSSGAAGDKNPFTSSGLSKEDQAAVEAFSQYQVKTCLSSILPSGVPTDLGDLPSDLPTDLGDLASNLPTDLPSDLASRLSEIPTDPAELQSYLDKLSGS